jgi:hypothetical protein
MASDQEKPDAGQKVVLVSLPDRFLDDLPQEDQDAMTAIIGVPISLVGYDEDGRAELEFAEAARPGYHHTIWVDAKHIRAYQ